METKEKKEGKPTETPLMKQYNQIKAKHPHALLLFRVGDFYETFGDDAVIASKILGITLTKRGAGSSSEIALAGFPHHSLEVYLPRLVRAGQRVAVCDQLEDPKMTKTIVKRGVTELVTPGVAYNDQVLDKKKNNFLCALNIDKSMIGISFIDVSTGEFLVAQGPKSYIDKLIQGFEPTEIIYAKSQKNTYQEWYGDIYYSYRLEDWVFGKDYSHETLQKHFQTNSLKGFGVEKMEFGNVAAGAILHYLSDNQQDKLAHITSIQRIEEENYVWLDKFTIRNLELVSSMHENATTLADILDYSKTPMGGRLMKRWIVLPLKHKHAIEDRHQVVSYFFQHQEQLEAIQTCLKEIGDIERLISKVSVGKVNPRELMQLRRTIGQILPIKIHLKGNQSLALQKLIAQLDECPDLLKLIDETLCADPAIQIGKGWVIKEGKHQELDDLRTISQNSKDYLENLQEREIVQTGIPSLKIAFNNVFGYYLEVRNTHKDKVPTTWIRKQTLVSAERYITEELKDYETKILGAEDKIQQIEAQLYQQLLFQVAEYIPQLQKNAFIIAQLDCLGAFAEVALQNNYVLPSINEGLELRIEEGRHPVIEKQLKHGEVYIPNDVYLNDSSQQIIMITGPNMSGKSAILRQTALICLMAQMGSFVPAKKLELGLIDKVFTRVGASDNISSGESTFMVEMNETASILNNISERSLILLDEIGRGTSTYDGISIAWAIAEYLHEHPKAKAKTLFATHYHEINEMAKQFEGIKNFNVSVKELDQKVLFMRKLIPGGSEHSFGIHVAKLAGMPSQVLKRAENMLKELEKTHDLTKKSTKSKVKDVASNANMQLSFFQLNDPVLEQIREELVAIDINTLTPVEALMKLNEIKKITGG